MHNYFIPGEFGLFDIPADNISDELMVPNQNEDTCADITDKSVCKTIPP